MGPKTRKTEQKHSEGDPSFHLYTLFGSLRENYCCLVYNVANSLGLLRKKLSKSSLYGKGIKLLEGLNQPQSEFKLLSSILCGRFGFLCDVIWSTKPNFAGNFVQKLFGHIYLNCRIYCFYVLLAGRRIKKALTKLH